MFPAKQENHVELQKHTKPQMKEVESSWEYSWDPLYARRFALLVKDSEVKMKKIPTLFERKYISNCVVETLPIVTKGMEWVLNGDGIATVKFDGSCCAIINGEFYKRYDAKNGKPVPEGAIKCQEKADPITGHFPCWVKVDDKNRRINGSEKHIILQCSVV